MALHKYTISYQIDFPSGSKQDEEFHNEFIKFLTSKGANNVKLEGTSLVRKNSVIESKVSGRVDNVVFLEDEILLVTEVKDDKVILNSKKEITLDSIKSNFKVIKY